MFIGRENELKFLENKYAAKGGQLVVLYGRRRIGKTETLRQFCKDKQHVYYVCRECADKEQLSSFSQKILKQNKEAARYIDEFTDWEKAFNSIIDLPYRDKKKLVIIDEFPYMCKMNTSIPSIIQNIWDEKLKDENVMIVLCGSAMSFIEKEILSEENPLYGRATGIYKMKEMGFYDAIKFFPNYSNNDKFLAYSILGGVPHYLRQFNPDISIEDNIKGNILTKGCPLYTEVEFMLRQELRETSLYNSIIEAIALGNTKLNDISNKALINNTAKTSVYLKNLIELEIIEREFSIDDSFKKKANNNAGLYRLTDNFFRFWYAFVFRNYSELEMGDVDGVYKYAIEPYMNDQVSYIFENVCKEYISRLNMSNQLPFRYTQMGRSWGKIKTRNEQGKLITKENEIDILAISNDKKQYLVGECKYKNVPFSYKEYIETTKKINIDNNELIYYWLFSKNGFDKKILEEVEGNDSVRLSDIDEIVEMEE